MSKIVSQSFYVSANNPYISKFMRHINTTFIIQLKMHKIRISSRVFFIHSNCPVENVLWGIALGSLGLWRVMRMRHSMFLGEPPGNDLGVPTPQTGSITGHTGESGGCTPVALLLAGAVLGLP